MLMLMEGMRVQTFSNGHPDTGCPLRTRVCRSIDQTIESMGFVRLGGARSLAELMLTCRIRAMEKQLREGRLLSDLGLTFQD